MPNVTKPFLVLGEWQFGSAPVYANGVEVGHVSMYGLNRFQFHSPSFMRLGFSALGDTWLEAVAAWFCVAACVPAGILRDLFGGVSGV